MAPEIPEHRFRSRTSVVLAAAFLVAGCAGGAGAQGVKRTSKPRATLEQAQQAFFGNHYTDGENGYRLFLEQNPRSVEGHAGYALLLNYRHRFTEALGEAEAASSLNRRSALALAVSTRVHDWSARTRADLKEAVALGKQAVDLGPRLALAHAFYGEALSDLGDTQQALKEIGMGGQLAQTVYEKAEVERELSNLAAGQGDKQEQGVHLRKAQAIQPGWAERSRELAEYYFAENQLKEALDQFHQALAMAPDDSSLAESLGNVALLRQDIPAADGALSAAAKNRAGDPGLNSTLAMTHFGVQRDAGVAEGLLRKALGEAPSDILTAQLLEGFLRYIKGDPGAAALVTVGRPPRDPLDPRAKFPESVDRARAASRQAGLDAVNSVRQKAHLAPVHLDDRISAGATSHAYWWLFNLSREESKGLGIHHEVAGTPGFTGFSMRDRATHFGYPQGLSMAEDITHRGDPTAAVADWVDSVFHRFPIMRPDLDAIGFGEATGGILPIEVMDMGYRNEAGDLREMVAYPADGQDRVPTSFAGNELPDPVPNGGKYPVGYPITLNFNPLAHVVVADHHVEAPGGKRLLLYSLEPDPQQTENVLSMLPREPLLPKTVYRVHVNGTIDGAAFTRDWTFTTEA